MMEIGVFCSSYVTLSGRRPAIRAVICDPGGSVVSSSLRARRPPRWWPAGLAWAVWALAMLGIAAGLWWDHLLRQAGRADLVQANGNVLAWLLAGVSASTVGAVLAAQRPRHPVGWLLLGLGASLGLTFLTDSYALYGLLARPGSLPAARWPAI